MDIAWFKTLNAAVLALTDELGIHREAVSVSLDRDGDGGATLSGDRLSVIGPAHDDVDAFAAKLRADLEAMDLSALPRAEEA